MSSGREAIQAESAELDSSVLNSGQFACGTGDVEPISSGEVFGRALAMLGVQRGYGVMGGGAAHLVSGMEAGGVRLVHVRHESSAAFAACEEYLVSGTPAAIWTTTGPGFVNALNGVIAIGWEGAKALLLSAATAKDIRPGFAFQDTRRRNLDAIGQLVAPHAALSLSYPQTAYDIYQLLDEWRLALRRPGAFVGAALVPLQLQRQLMKPWVPTPIDDPSPTALRDDAYAQIAATLRSGSVLIWTGFGVRGASQPLRELVARLDARVTSSPRSKGSFPETDPAYLGVTGHGGHERVLRYLREEGVDTLLVLGSRLHELTSFRDTRFSPRKSVIHVDCERSALINDFLGLPTLAVHADVASFLSRLLEFIPKRAAKNKSFASAESFIEEYPQGAGIGIHPLELMAVVQCCVVERFDIPIMTDVGISWAWGPHCLRFDSPRYRTSTTWGSMCHFAAGVVGAAMASGKPALCITGDGSMLMQSEVSTAVQYGVPAKWIVLNNCGYGTIRHGLQAIRLPPMEVDFPPTRFDKWAESQGARAVRVTTPDELAAALQIAFKESGPFVIDAVIDPTVAPPCTKRNSSLMPQGGTQNRT